MATNRQTTVWESLREAGRRLIAVADGDQRTELRKGSSMVSGEPRTAA
jgi:hypothetical protein